jgi:predicted NBD/HSP70 family sugar kinase
MPINQRSTQKTSNKPRHIKYHNQKLILSMFRKRDILSIAEISRRINLSKTTVTKVVNDFEAKGLVVAVGKGDSTDVGGKKPELFSFNAAYSHVIALTIGTNSIDGAVMDLKCGLISQACLACGPEIPYYKAVLSLADMIRRLITDSGLKNDTIHPIVVGCEGIIDARGGIIHYTMHHKWGQNLPLRDDLSRALDFDATIYLDNNLRLGGYADMILNENPYDSQAVIITTTSAGGSILENQQLVHGTNGFIGEVGHMIIEPYSKIQCACGGYGCFGALVSPDTVLAQCRDKYRKFPQSPIFSKVQEGSLKITDIFEASNRNDPFACAVLDQVIHYFTIVIHNIVLLRDPEKIIIQGIYSDAGDYFLTNLQKKVNSLPFYKTERNLPVAYSSVSGFNPYLIGAGYYAVDILLDFNSLYD